MWKIWTSLYHLQTNGQCEGFNSTLINMLGMLPREKKSEWKNHIGTLVHAYNCTQNSATGFSPYYLMFRRQPHLPVDVTLVLAPHTTTEPDASKFVQKLREHTRWAQKKADAFQAKEAQRQKHNYDKRGRAAALEVRDMVLVHVTTFKGCHKIQDRWENREYVMEKWPYPNVPVYVVCPRNGEGHSQTLHRNYLLPINSNLKQGKKDEPVVVVENDTSPPPVPSVHLLRQDHLGWSQQPQQIAHPRAVQIDLLHSDAALRPPGTNFHGGTEILVCWPILDQLAFGMHGLTCVSAYVL